MTTRLKQLTQNIEPYRNSIIHHSLYGKMKSVEDIRCFMEHHIFAVWDFMSLLKSLQISLTCVSLPWRPVGIGSVRHLINEIVAGEESDIDQNGKLMSHFELYLNAMKQAEADTNSINNFLSALDNDLSLSHLLLQSNAPQGAQDFVKYTFDIIQNHPIHVQAAVFTFGREDLIPKMFGEIVNDLHKSFPDSISILKYYLERHIEVDGDHHAHLALGMLCQLCGEDDSKWNEAEAAVIACLQQRKKLWDSVEESLEVAFA